MPFEIVRRSSQNKARLGRFQTRHGVVETPAFMPVGTQATVKTVGSEDLEALGFQLVLANTYHLALRPGEELIHELGGIQRFMSWRGPILTDSGGYQVMSLGASRKISEEGVTFKSHLDGTELNLTPERSVAIQARLGVDVAMALDVCAPYPCSRDEAAAAMAQTHRWLPRNIAAKQEHHDLFGIVQGGIHEDMRRESAEYVSSFELDGYAIGGVSVGEPSELQHPVAAFTAGLLPEGKPRYLMGVGHPNDIIHGVKHGIDLFDCVLPTRMARHHCLYTLDGRINAMAERWSRVAEPHGSGPGFEATERYSAAYLRHLFKAKEALAARIATLHNLAFYARLMREIRDAIRDGTWDELEEQYARA